MATLPSNTGCTIYNQFGTGTTKKLIKHILSRVWWQETKGVSSIQSGVVNDTNVDIMINQLKGYKTPQEWLSLTEAEALSGLYYTLAEGDRVIKGELMTAPNTFTSVVEVDKHFGTSYSHSVTSVNTQTLPGGHIHHFRMLCR